MDSCLLLTVLLDLELSIQGLDECFMEGMQALPPVHLLQYLCLGGENAGNIHYLRDFMFFFFFCNPVGILGTTVDAPQPEGTFPITDEYLAFLHFRLISASAII